MRRVRVLHCPTLTAGHGGILASAERQLGLNSVSVATSSNYLEYKVDSILCKSSSLWRQQIALWGLLMKAAASYDVVHYNAGTTLLPHQFSSKHAKPCSLRWLLYRAYCALGISCEVALLQRKVIAVTFQGDDARQGDFCLSHYKTSIARYDAQGYYTKEKDRAARTRVCLFAKYADLIYAQNPDLLRVLPSHAKFLPYCCTLPELEKSNKLSRTKDFTVLHAPTNRQAKGTEFIISAVKRLQEEGITLHFKLVEGMTHSQAVQLYREADLVVDQLLVGWYGNFAAEVMAMGKPVICYIREEDLRLIPPQMAADLPVIMASPTSIYSVLKDCITGSRDELAHRGRASREFVKKWHDPLLIAKGVVKDYCEVARFKTADQDIKAYRH